MKGVGRQQGPKRGEPQQAAARGAPYSVVALETPALRPSPSVRTFVRIQLALVAAALGLKVVEIPIRASLTCDPPNPAQVKQFLDVVTDPANQPVYVHCQYGRDRTGAMCAVYRMEASGWTREEALEEMHAFGFRD